MFAIIRGKEVAKSDQQASALDQRNWAQSGPQTLIPYLALNQTQSLWSESFVWQEVYLSLQ